MTHARATTVPTADGPFTLLVDGDGAVLASGWTAELDRVVARVRAADRPTEVAVVAADDPAVAAPVAAVAAYYDGDLAAVETVRVRHHGSAWRLAGWARLRAIRAGAPLSYAELAAALDRPTAVRAAASVCATNAPALFVPCHRVLRSDGSLGGFAWGLDVKHSLLARESPSP